MRTVSKLSHSAAHLLLAIALEGEAGVSAAQAAERAGIGGNSTLSSAISELEAGGFIERRSAGRSYTLVAKFSLEGGGVETPVVYQPPEYIPPPSPPPPSPPVVQSPQPQSAVDIARQADAGRDGVLKQRALQQLWDEVFPRTEYPVRLTRTQASDLLSLAGGSAVFVCEALTTAVRGAKKHIEFPPGFAKAVVRSHKQRAESGGDASKRQDTDYPDEYMANLLAFQKDVYAHNKEEGRVL